MSSRFAVWIAVALLTGASTASPQVLRNHRHDASGGPPVPAGSVTAGIGVSHRPLSVAKETIWTKLDIPVCWEDADSSNASLRAAIQTKIAQTWEANSRVKFTGWGQCNDASTGLRVVLNGDDPGAHVKALGKDLDGMRNGVNLRADKCVGDVPCLLKVSVHEFGHALGFSHEQNRSDAPAWCRDKAQGQDGDVYMTPYDVDSVMNYCNPKSENDGFLSGRDITGLRFWYGPSTSSKIPWRPDCRKDVVLFEHIRYDGAAYRVYGSMQELGIDRFNDRASSACVPPGYRLTLFEDNYFSGESISIDGPADSISLDELKTTRGDSWNDRISSLKMIDLKSMQEVYDAQHECASRALIFDDWHFRGDSLDIGSDVPDLRVLKLNRDTNDRWSDRISSICVPAGHTLTLYDDINFGGKTLVFNGPAFIQTLEQSRWNDRASSIKWN